MASGLDDTPNLDNTHGSTAMPNPSCPSPPTPHPAPPDLVLSDLVVPDLVVPDLVVSDLAVFRGERLVLQDVSFRLQPGGALLLTGPNGSGKSTLLRVLAGLKRPDAGTVAGAGSVAYLGHGDAVKAALTPHELLGPAAAPALAALGLDLVAGVPGRMLSAGQKRRVAFARVLAARRRLWLLDEPSLGMDARAVDLLGTAVARHREAGGMVVAATHVALPLPGATSLSL